MQKLNSKLVQILDEKSQIKEAVNDFLGLNPVLSSGASAPSLADDEYSGYHLKISEIFSALNLSVSEKISWLNGIIDAVNGTYSDVLALNDYPGIASGIASKLSELKTREAVLEAVKAALGAACSASPDLGPIKTPSDSGLSGAISGAIEALQETVSARKSCLEDSAEAVDRYYTAQNLDPVVEKDFSDLSSEISTIVTVLQAAEVRLESLASSLSSIAVNFNTLIENVIEEIPEDESGNYSSLEDYKNSLKLEIVSGANGNLDRDLEIYASYPAKILSAGSQAEYTELRIIDTIIEAINSEGYGVSEPHKLPEDPEQVPDALLDALDDILAKGASNSARALKSEVQSDKDASGNPVIDSGDTEESGYASKIHEALQSWKTAYELFRSLVNEKISDVNLVTSLYDASEISESSAPDAYGTAVVNALQAYKDEIEDLNLKISAALSFKENIKDQVNGETEPDLLSDDASYEDIQTGLENVLDRLYAKIKNTIFGPEPFYIQNLSDEECTVTLAKYGENAPSVTLEYSTDGMASWTSVSSGDADSGSFTIPGNGKAYLRGDVTSFMNDTDGSVTYFNFDRQCSVGGHLASLANNSDAVGTLMFTGMFIGNANLVSAENLVLPNSTALYCYGMMFYGCTSLTAAPELPATTLANSCYGGMFSGCTSLTTAPALPATTLVDYCYDSMFQDCTSLTTAPALPATTLAEGCYSCMFQGCTSLTTAPELPATTLANRCYDSMFKGCTSLTTAPALPATTLAYACCREMFYNCTSLTTAPELPATTLASYCYSEMFYGCTSLTTAPELPATTLARGCYDFMFQGCTSLNYIKAMFTTAPSYEYTYNWVRGVSSTGTFIKSPDATWDVTGVDGVPEGWTVQTAAA